VTSEVILPNGSSQTCPEVWIDVDTPYVKGGVVALVMNSPFADLIVGNYTRVDIPQQMPRELDKAVDEKCQAVETRASAKQTKRECDVLEERSVVSEIVCRDEWLEEQGKDSSLEQFRKRTRDCSEENFIIRENGMMYRVFKTKSGDILKQVIVPSKFRKQILALGHDIPMAGHLGIKKTRERVLRNFFGQVFLKIQNHIVNPAQNASWERQRKR
jgi:hypothetical protein